MFVYTLGDVIFVVAVVAAILIMAVATVADKVSRLFKKKKK